MLLKLIFLGFLCAFQLLVMITSLVYGGWNIVLIFVRLQSGGLLYTKNTKYIKKLLVIIATCISGSIWMTFGLTQTTDIFVKLLFIALDKGLMI